MKRQASECTGLAGVLLSKRRTRSIAIGRERGPQAEECKRVFRVLSGAREAQAKCEQSTGLQTRSRRPHFKLVGWWWVFTAEKGVHPSVRRPAGSAPEAAVQKRAPTFQQRLRLGDWTSPQASESTPCGLRSSTIVDPGGDWYRSATLADKIGRAHV